MRFQYDDGGRKAAGYQASRVGDCAVRAVAIATGLSYQTVYDGINEAASDERPRGERRRSNARTGVWPATVSRFLAKHGWRWVPTMSIGSGCRVHLSPDELPGGRLVVRVSKHYVAVIDGIVHDTHDPSREGTRCVYGYWVKA